MNFQKLVTYISSSNKNPMMSENSNNWVYIACTDSKTYSWMVCVAPCKFFKCLQQHLNQACNWKSPMISSKSELNTSVVLNSLQLLPYQESLTSNHWYFVATHESHSNVVDSSRPYVVHVSDDILYKCTTVRLNGDSTATLWHYHLPVAPNTRTIILFLFPTAGINLA